MTLSKGWINRQITRVERESKTWPDWMRRETNLRAEEQKASAERISHSNEKQASSPQTKKPGEA
jgi:hypothetical protein